MNLAKTTLAAGVIAASMSSAFAQEAAHVPMVHYNDDVPRTDIHECLGQALLENAPGGEDVSVRKSDQFKEYIFEAGINPGSFKDGNWVGAYVSMDKTGEETLKIMASDMGPADQEETDATFSVMLDKDNIQAPGRPVKQFGANASVEAMQAVRDTAIAIVTRARELCLDAGPQ